MTRLVALFLALLLPLQFAWGAAAAHCQHETAPKLAQHFGHHEHVHKDTTNRPVEAKLHIDSDCAYCNAAAPHAFIHAQASVPKIAPAFFVNALPSTALSSAPARAPDRPQWNRLA